MRTFVNFLAFVHWNDYLASEFPKLASRRLLRQHQTTASDWRWHCRCAHAVYGSIWDFERSLCRRTIKFCKPQWFWLVAKCNNPAHWPAVEHLGLAPLLHVLNLRFRRHHCTRDQPSGHHAWRACNQAKRYELQLSVLHFHRRCGWRTLHCWRARDHAW